MYSVSPTGRQEYTDHDGVVYQLTANRHWLPKSRASERTTNERGKRSHARRAKTAAQGRQILGPGHSEHLSPAPPPAAASDHSDVSSSADMSHRAPSTVTSVSAISSGASSTHPAEWRPRLQSVWEQRHGAQPPSPGDREACWSDRRTRDSPGQGNSEIPVEPQACASQAAPQAPTIRLCLRQL